MWEYSDKVQDHYRNPRNVGMMEDANAVGYAGSLTCGDAITLFLKFDEQDIVTAAKFLAFGCGSAVAVASILTEIVIGKHVDELAKITNQDIVDALDGLPEAKIHCSVMCKEVLEYAIREYKNENTENENKTVCQCFDVKEDLIVDVIRKNNLKTIEEITNYTKAGGGCGKCKNDLLKILDNETSKEIN